MNTRQQDIVISRKEAIDYYAHSKYNSHIGRVVAKGMLDLDYTYSQLANISGLKDSTNVRLIVRGQRRDPQFSSVVKLAKALDLSLDKFLEEK